jgi:hypothetical protein
VARATRNPRTRYAIGQAHSHEGGSVIDHSGEPAILDRIVLETPSAGEWLPHVATIANLTPEEVWVGLDEPLGPVVDPGQSVHIVLGRSGAYGVPAETTVVRHVGTDGRVVVLARPESWAFGTRRANARARLAIPAYLKPGADTQVVPARTTNLGLGGFHCVSDIPVAVGHRMPVVLQLTPVDKLECNAQVVRLDDDPTDPAGRRVVVALRFLDLTEDNEATIAAALLALAGEAEADGTPKAWHAG